MAIDPATILSLIGTFGPPAISLFAGQAPQPDEQFARLYARLKGLTQEDRNRAVTAARASGDAFAQDYRALLGESGLSSTGVGAKAGALAGTVSTDLQNRAIADYDSKLLNQATQLFGTGQFNQQGFTRMQSLASGLVAQQAQGRDPVGAAATSLYNAGNSVYQHFRPGTTEVGPGVGLGSGGSRNQSRYDFFNPQRNPARRP